MTSQSSPSPSHRAKVLRQAKASLRRGWKIVPVARRTKAPRLKNWPDLRLTEADLKTTFSAQDNVGVILGEPSAGLVDVDLDSPFAIALAPGFLPPTERIHGRRGKPNSHYWYRTSPIPESAKLEDTNGECFAELRCGPRQQTVIPPSFHPSGEQLRWTPAGEPGHVEGYALSRGVKKLAACALVAKHWPQKGSRHDFALALAAVLLRQAGWDAEAVVNFVLAAARAARDEEWARREHDVQSTAQRLAAGQPVTGLSHLADLAGEKVVAKLRAWLDFQSPESSAGHHGQPVTWPDPPAEEAFHGLAGEFVRLTEPHTEADPVAILVQILVAFGNCIGHAARLVVEGTSHHANLFAVLVGNTSKARKGTSWGRAKTVLADADQSWLATCTSTGLSSGEGLINAVRDPLTREKLVNRDGRKRLEMVVVDRGVADKRLLVVEEEFAKALAVMGRDGNTLSATIRQAWESGNLQVMTRNSPLRATGAHISIIGHITRDELLRHLTVTEEANGFANRFLWLCVRRSKCLPFGGKLNLDQLAQLGDRLRHALAAARGAGEMKWGKKAAELWRQVYPGLSEGKPGLLGAVTSRAEAQVIRLATIYALLDGLVVIRVEHLKAALALWNYCEQSAKYIFGDSLGDPTADMLYSALCRRGAEGLTRTEIRDLFSRNQSTREIDRALGVLASLGLARSKKHESAGRPVERWFADSVPTTKTT